MGSDIIRNQIRRFRFEYGEMTQEELARHVGCSRQTIIALEAGRYRASLGLAFRLAKCFGVRIEDLFQHSAEKLDEMDV